MGGISFDLLLMPAVVAPGSLRCYSIAVAHIEFAHQSSCQCRCVVHDVVKIQ